MRLKKALSRRKRVGKKFSRRRYVKSEKSRLRKANFLRTKAMFPKVDYKHADLTRTWEQWTSDGGIHAWQKFINLQEITYSSTPTLSQRSGQEVIIARSTLEIGIRQPATGILHYRFFLLALETPLPDINNYTYAPYYNQIVDLSVTTNWYQADWLLKEQRSQTKPRWVVLKDKRRAFTRADPAFMPTEWFVKFRIPARRIEYFTTDTTGVNIVGGRPLVLGIITDATATNASYTLMFPYKVKFLDTGSKR